MTRAVRFDELPHVIHPWEWIVMYPIFMAKEAVKHNIMAKVTQLAGLELEFKPRQNDFSPGLLPRFLPSLPEHWFWRKSCRAVFPKLCVPGKNLIGNVKSSDGKICGNTASCPSLETNNVLHHTRDLENNRQIFLTLFKWPVPKLIHPWYTSYFPGGSDGKESA